LSGVKERVGEQHFEVPILYIFISPNLTTELLAQGEGVIAGRILARIRHPSWFQGWRVRMRYEHQVSSPAVVATYNRWSSQTDDLFREIGL
jgi:hypothetical protein